MINIEELTGICDKLGCRITPECSLREYITFRFGGPCRALISINSAEAAAELMKYFRERSVKYGILGRGSNIIVPDDGFDGVILLFGSDFANITIEGTKIHCEAGALLASACVHAQQAGLSGLENLFGIPGTVGGALYMNAGAYGTEIKDIIVSAEYIDSDCSIHTMLPGDSDAIKASMNECMAKRSSKQPLDYPSAGSTFKRPAGSYASLLIDQCGLKGLTCGGAMVSEKHSGFVVNKGYATCSDVLELCEKVQKIVKEKTGYILELEPVILR